MAGKSEENIAETKPPLLPRRFCLIRGVPGTLLLLPRCFHGCIVAVAYRSGCLARLARSFELRPRRCSRCRPSLAGSFHCCVEVGPRVLHAVSDSIRGRLSIRLLKRGCASSVCGVRSLRKGAHCSIELLFAGVNCGAHAGNL